MVEILWVSELENGYDKGAIQRFSDCVGDVCGVNILNLVSIIFTSDREIAILNLKYRNKKGSTDILTFSFLKNNFCWPKTVDRCFFLGEMFISTNMLYVNATYFGVSDEEELKRLIIHGFLHIVGYDHKTNESSDPMIQFQEKLLQHFYSFSLKKVNV